MAWISRVVVLASLVLAAPALAETRVALVVGNGAYAGPRMALRNPPADAKLVGGLLERIGFSVDLVVDGGRERMYEALDRFATRAESADVALFYFAGHGIQDLGQNFLMPVDAELKRQRDLRDRFVPLDDVLQSLSQARGAKILVLDACRDNEAVDALRAAVPKSRSTAVSRGLAAMPKVSGMLVAFATQPGLVAADGASANSPFTEALARHLAESGLELRQALTRVRIDVAKATAQKQVPEVSNSLLGEIFLNPVAPLASANDLAAGPSAGEIAFWMSVESAKSEALYRAYLERYGDSGAFAPIARDRVAATKPASRLETPGLPAVSNSAAVSTVVPRNKAIVDQLPPLGTDSLPSSEPERSDLAKLLGTSDAAVGDPRPEVGATAGQDEAAPAASLEEAFYWVEAEAAKSPALYRTYLDRYGFEGAYAATAYDRIMDDLKARKATIGLMGVKIQSLTEEGRAKLSPPPEGGVVIAEVLAGSAERAGIKSGDVVLTVDLRPVSDPRELAYRVAFSPGRAVEVGIARGGERLTKRVTLDSHTFEAEKK